MEAETTSLLPNHNEAAPPFDDVHPVMSRAASRYRDRQNETDAGIRHSRPKLTERHIGIVAIAGMMGTGIFLTSGRSLVDAGPGGALLGYFLVEPNPPLFFFARVRERLTKKRKHPQMIVHARWGLSLSQVRD